MIIQKATHSKVHTSNRPLHVTTPPSPQGGLLLPRGAGAAAGAPEGGQHPTAPGAGEGGAAGHSQLLFSHGRDQQPTKITWIIPPTPIYSPTQALDQSYYSHPTVIPRSLISHATAVRPSYCRTQTLDGYSLHQNWHKPLIIIM